MGERLKERNIQAVIPLFGLADAAGGHEDALIQPEARQAGRQTVGFIRGKLLEFGHMGRDDAAILRGRHARVEINLRGIRNVGDIQREGEGRAVEHRVVDGDGRILPGQPLADGQDMPLIDGVVFLLAVEMQHAEIRGRARRRRQQKRQQGERQRIGELAAHARRSGGMRAAQGIGLHLRRERQAGEAGVNGFAKEIIVHSNPTFPAPA